VLPADVFKILTILDQPDNARSAVDGACGRARE
jgi:hypothetical protein